MEKPLERRTVIAVALGLLAISVLWWAISPLIEHSLSHPRYLYNEAAAVVTLRQINDAQQRYYAAHVNQSGRGRFAPDLDDLLSASRSQEGGAKLPILLDDGHFKGYRFDVYANAQDWRATARPLEVDKSGKRVFVVGTDGAIRYTVCNLESTSTPETWPTLQQ